MTTTDAKAPVAQVATCIAAPGERCLDLALIARLRALLPGAEIAVLSERIAVDLHFTGEASGDYRGELAAACAGKPVDIVVQPGAGRRKQLFLADMDSTMIAQECIDELGDAVGLRAEISAITERAMRGEIAFEPALRERVALLKGLAVDIVDDLIERRITLTAGGRALVATMRAQGAYAALVSGGFTRFTGPIAAKIGFDMHRANQLIEAEGRFVGEVAEPILGREAKRATLLELTERFALPKSASLAVGDGANDLAMLGEAGLGVAFHAKPIVAAAAHARIDHADLTALLYLQGYRDAEIIGGAA